MTRKEAIELLDILPLCNECDSNNFPYTCVECGDAFLLAMEALKQPEIVRCKDCKHWSAERINDFNKCRRWINVGVKNFATMGEWFCADGERE